MKGSEAKLLGFMEGANNRYVIPVYLGRRCPVFYCF